MAEGTLAAALEREHREIDAGIEEFTSRRAGGEDGTAALTGAMAALRRHIYLEEQFMFPTLRSAGMMAPVFVMLREHGDIWKVLDRLEAELARDGSGPEAVSLCGELSSLLDAHNSKEEPIIYPQADAVLPEPATVELTSFLDAGRMPEGWVCERAGA
jgi:regulator of cell morphogenesis and NO signaling